MAARNSSRGARRRGRLGGNRPRTHPPRSAAERLAAKGPSATEVLIREIRLLALRLEVIYRTAVTVEMALRYQNADQDRRLRRLPAARSLRGRLGRSPRRHTASRHASAVCGCRIARVAGSNHEFWEAKASAEDAAETCYCVSAACERRARPPFQGDVDHCVLPSRMCVVARPRR